jgi:small-conductance mechanosensitive channel
MNKPFHRLFFLCLFFPAAVAVAEQAASPAAITPDAAKRAIAVLEDDRQRADVILTLKAVAETGATAPPATGATAEERDEPPLQSAPAEAPAIVPLEADGLIAQTLRQIGRWADHLGEQVVQLKQAASELPDWSRSSFGNDAGRRRLLHALLALALLFGLGLALEGGLRWLLKRPRVALIAHADEVASRADAMAQERLGHQRQADQARAAQAQEDRSDAGRQQAATAGTQPEQAGVALVQTHRNGVDEVEAVAVESAQSATGEPTLHPDEAVASHDAAAPSGARGRPASSEHRSSVRHLPFALAALVLDLLPLVPLFCVAAVLAPRLSKEVSTVTTGFFDAYVATRMTLAIVALLLSPAGHGLRVLRLSPAISVVLQTWIRRFIIVATFGVALADAAQVFGAGQAGRLAIIKVISLVVHLFVVILIFQVRRPVGQVIAAPEQATGPLASARNWLAQIWPVLAAVLIMGAWVVWALGVEDGFPKLLHFIAVSGIVIILGRAAAILALGVMGRAFGGDAAGEAGGEPRGAGGFLSERYYPAARRLVSLLITTCTVLVLFQIWGFDAIAWFDEGTIGRGLISAMSTILVAAVMAIVVWQFANGSIERRLARWQKQGDMIRAARLRTLVPMLRSGLLVLMVLIVGLTALNQIGINTTPLLAGASIIGVALGFGSQKLVQDFITGIFLLMENAMQVGDWVTVAGVSGTVEYLSIRTVRLRAGDGSLHIVPFSSVSTVNNTNRGIGNAAVRISVSQDADVEQVITELKSIGEGLRKDPNFGELILNDIEIWGVDSVDGSMVTVAGQMRCIDKGRWGVQREINRLILERFRALNIEIADPRSRLLVPRGSALPEAPNPCPTQRPE